MRVTEGGPADRFFLAFAGALGSGAAWVTILGLTWRWWHPELVRLLAALEGLHGRL